jgi:hypothetical protein
MGLDTVITAGAPSLLIALIGFFARGQLDSIQSAIRTVSTELKELNAKVGGHGEELSGVRARLDALERDVHGLLGRRGRR